MSAPRVTLLFAARGGTGRSVLAANLAIVFVRKLRQPSILLDLDWLGGGQLASALDLETNGTWKDALVEDADIKRLLAVHASGVLLLAAPPAGTAPPPTVHQLIKLVAALSRMAPQIVIDTTMPNLASSVVEALFDLASTVVLVIIPDIPTLYNTRALLEQVSLRHYPRDRVQVVLNRSGVTQDVHPNDLVEHLGRPLLATVPFAPAIISSVNRGVPITAGGGGGPVAAAIVQLAQKILALPAIDLARAGQEIASKSRDPKKMGPYDPSIASYQGDIAMMGTPQSAQLELPGRDPETAGMTPSESLALVPAEVAADARLVEARQAIHRMLVEDLKRQDMALDRLLDPQYKQEIREKVERVVAGIVERMRDLPATSREQRTKLVRDITNEAIGYGPLEGFLADQSVTEIMVNGPRQIYVERNGRLGISRDTFTDETQLRVVVDRIVAPLGRRVDEASPMCDARLPDGSRVNVIVPPLSLRGSVVTIRKFPLSRLTIEQLISYGSLNQEMGHFLKCCVLGRLNVFISGGTGSGKTTLLNVLSSFIPPNERIVTIEDAAELQLGQPHVIPLESRPPNLEGSGAVAIRDLVRNSLRMRPDRIVVGEIRGGEALDMLQAMNTGHDGSLSTGHANSPRDALSRIETMVLMAGMDLPVRAIREQIASAIHVIVQVSRLRDGTRKITRISEITGMESDVITMQDLYTFDQTAVDPDGVVMGAFRFANLRPHAAEYFERAGLKVEMGQNRDAS